MTDHVDEILEAAKERFFAGKDPSLRMEKLMISGLHRIRPDIVEREFKPVSEATSFAQLIAESERAARRLRSMGVFQSVDVLCDEGSDPTLSRVKVVVEEYKAFTAKAGSFVGTEEGTFMASGEYRSPFGGLERIEGSVNYGTKHKLSFAAAYKQPRLLDRTLQLEWRAFNAKQNRRASSDYLEHDIGMSVSLRAARAGIWHSLIYEAVQRALTLTDTASPTLVEEVIAEKNSLKSSVTYSAVRDRRNDVMFPTRGSYASLRCELAGVGGGVFFTKHELAGTAYVPLPRGISLALGLQAGYMRALASDHLRISDRFFVGGHGSMRGFANRSLGVKDMQDPRRTHTHLGGDLYGVVSAILSAPVPSHLVPGLRARGQFFVNAGNLVASGASVRDALTELVQDYRLSVGVGVVMSTPFGRIEFNYCRPLRVFSTDDTQTWQFGLGVGI